MKYYFTTILLLILACTNHAQEWSEPVNVSNMEGTDYFPDFCIDGNGVIHCVWAHHYGGEFIKVFYARSEDEGSTWSIPEDVSQNSSLWCLQPHIVANSKNQLFVSYDYDSYSTTQSLIVLKSYDGDTWSEMDTVSVGMPGARKNRLIIDSNDKIYCFWYHDLNYGGIYYRAMYNDQWSEIETPFDNNDFYAASDVCVDSNDNMHLSGLYRQYGQNYDDIRTFYCMFENSSWMNFELFGDDQCIETAIDTDHEQNPHLCWKQYTSTTIPPNDGTIYSGFNGTTWSEPELIVEDPSEQIIIVDENDRANIFDTEKTEDGSMLVHYYRFNGTWQGYIVDESDWYGMNPQIINFSDELYVIYKKPIDDDVNSEIFFTHSDIISSIPESMSEEKNIKLDMYPNPFSQTVTIDIALGVAGKTTIKIYNLKGELLRILMEKDLPSGNYKIVWDGTNSKNTKLPGGLYLVRLQHGKYVMTCSLQFIH